LYRGIQSSITICTSVNKTRLHVSAIQPSSGLSTTFVFVLSIPLCYFKIQLLYTVKHNTSNIDENTLHRRHVSAHIVAIFRPYAKFRTTTDYFIALECRRHLLSTSVIKLSIRVVVKILVIPSLVSTSILTTTFNQDFNKRR
jgi:hypothetical protein